MPGALSKLHSALEVVLSGTDERWLIIKNAVFLIVVIRLLNAVVGDMYRHGVARVLREYRTALLKTIFAYGKRIPAIQSLVKKEVGKVAKDIEHSVAPKDDAHVATTRLPAKGVAMATIKAEVDRLSVNPKVKVDAGRVSGAVYWGGKDVTALSTYVYEKFAWSNPLHPDVFPGLRRMDAEIVAMVVNMYNGGTEGCGTTTSGGTESILLAMKTYRDWALETKGVREPELIVPATAHAAFDKAAGYFGIKLYHADVDKVTGRVKLADVRRLVNRNTIAVRLILFVFCFCLDFCCVFVFFWFCMVNLHCFSLPVLSIDSLRRSFIFFPLPSLQIAGSAPGFPHGIIDDIEGLAAIARKNNIGLHVDCCLGGFIVPFMEKAGFPLPRFDFRVKGVTSISCDTHKYGFAPKGSSVIMYANRELRRFQYFVAEDWTGGTKRESNAYNVNGGLRYLCLADDRRQSSRCPVGRLLGYAHVHGRGGLRQHDPRHRPGVSPSHCRVIIGSFFRSFCSKSILWTPAFAPSTVSSSMASRSRRSWRGAATSLTSTACRRS